MGLLSWLARPKFNPDWVKVDNWRKAFVKKAMARKEAIIWNAWEHTGWGDSIGISGKGKDMTELRLYGHLTPLPVKGDIFRTKMQSGKTAEFIFKEVKPCFDPPDMFFADVVNGHYL